MICQLNQLIACSANSMVGPICMVELSMTLDDRKTAFENKFAHDAELQFKVNARRNKLLGLWAAGLLKLTSEEADAYAKSVVQADFEEAGDDDVFRKVHGDLSAKGVEISDHDVRAAMAQCMTQAQQQILGS